MQCFQVITILQILRKEIKKKTKITLVAGSVSTRDVTKTKALFNIYHYAVLASVVQRICFSSTYPLKIEESATGSEPGKSVCESSSGLSLTNPTNRVLTYFSY